MSDFVEQCRREWRRLGVPDPLAEEMATDLASDLREAEAEGVSAEELLGSSAFDPLSFAAAWAAERGIIPVPPSQGATRKPVSLIAFTAVATIALIAAAALLLTGEPKLTLRTSRPPHPLGPLPPGIGGQVHQTSASAPVEWILLVLAIRARLRRTAVVELEALAATHRPGLALASAGRAAQPIPPRHVAALTRART
jgi:hypothetical protein